MQHKYLLYILPLIIVFLFSSAVAQSPESIATTKVSSLPDEKIIDLWNQAKAQGLTETEVYAVLKQKGMPASEIEELKNRVTLLGLSGTGSATKTSSAPPVNKIDHSRTNTDTVSKPTAKKQEEPKKADNLTIYGYDMFRQSGLSFEPNFSAPTPKNYILGPGDEVIVLVTGLNERDIKSVVTPEGNLQIPNAGIIAVAGFTIEQATSLIKRRLAKVYPAIESGKTSVTISLGNIRRIRVTVTGEVNTPGGYTVSALTPLFNVLYNSGGPNANGSLRQIRLIRNNKLFKTVDLYEFLQQGTMPNNIRLEDQDVINIPVYKKLVGIKGEIKRPAYYELKDNETMADLIAYAGGFTAQAYKGVAKLIQINDLQKDVKDVSANSFGNYVLRNGDMVEINPITDRYTNRIILEGMAYRPGVYELVPGLTLSQLLKNAQGLKPEAYMERGFIKRTMPDLQRTSIPFDPRQILAGKNDIPLMREDSILILSQDVFISNQKIAVNGYVRKPVTITYRSGLKLADVIALAGGFDDEAAAHHVEVSRIINNKSDSVATQLVSTFVVNMEDPSDPNYNVELQPRDVVNVLRLVNNRPLGNVKIRGEVVFPNDYAVQKRDETAQEFLTRAGGITPFGSAENVQIFRSGVRVNVDVLSAKSKNILLPGDSIYVPRVISNVEVAGAVNNPQYILYKGRNFKYYIDAVGGTTQKARLKGAYIKYPNGMNRPVKNVLFFKSYPPVKPGSKIIVPEKSPDARIKVGISDLGGIAAALTALVSIVAILSK
ncbi:SLBB domain-containing protein [Mucilaginibacter calamicampi]|uniref:SLBB domain-containing protein n=1 Tax=Mucilaginibacter calamicampi TaxID=1302352 RepID=A0ABW2YWS9_9SPHI